MEALRRAPTPDALRRPGEARAFLTQAYTEEAWPGLAARLAAVEREIARTGTYDLTPEELHAGARLAWRNSTRCVGRAYWRYLELRDRRDVTDPDAVFADLVEHLRAAWNSGSIRPTIGVYGPGVRVVNDQLIRYADDPKNAPLVAFLRGRGWRPAGTRFEVLPVAIRSGRELRLYDLPHDAVHEVELVHPDCPAFAELGLRWHALPVISDLRLEVGGLDFPCAPFNGWYLGTEIGARNLADADRYDALPAVARALGLDTSRERTLWRDRALVELNAAVLFSFDRAGAKIADHHSVTRHFVRFEERERAAGREVAGRWSWLVPPLSPAATPVYHRTYEDRVVNPNFHPQEKPWEARGCPFGH